MILIALSLSSATFHCVCKCLFCVSLNNRYAAYCQIHLKNIKTEQLSLLSFSQLSILCETINLTFFIPAHTHIYIYMYIRSLDQLLVNIIDGILLETS